MLPSCYTCSNWDTGNLWSLARDKQLIKHTTTAKPGIQHQVRCCFFVGGGRWTSYNKAHINSGDSILFPLFYSWWPLNITSNQTHFSILSKLSLPHYLSVYLHFQKLFYLTQLRLMERTSSSSLLCLPLCGVSKGYVITGSKILYRCKHCYPHLLMGCFTDGNWICLGYHQPVRAVAYAPKWCSNHCISNLIEWRNKSTFC